jgi:hypothetical protein
VDVAVTVDLGLVSQQSALLAQAFTYRADGGAGSCNGVQGLFIATVKPADPTNPGSPDGGEIVVIKGGGFTAGGTSTTLDRTDVFFGGKQGVTTNVSDDTIEVSTPRRVLASPDRPETVDVKVIVDAGGPREACVQSTGAYTYYPGGFLEPVITSISPSAGPNDAATRVTMFGRNFKLPMQVFVGGVEAAVVEIKASQIIFLTPVATGPNSALAGQTVDVVVRDPYAGKDYTSPVRFRYYSCPTLNTVVPSSTLWNVSTVVTITGQNFEEPVEVTYTPGGAGGGSVIRPTVTSVSSSLITIVMPAIDPGLGAAASCSGISGALSISFPNLDAGACDRLDTTFTYRIEPMTAVSASPSQLNQTGGPAGSILSSPPVTITVMGTNFLDPMTVQLIKDGALVGNTATNNAVVANPGQLSFAAPAVPNGALNEQVCVPEGGTTPTGLKWVPTSFGIRLKNTRTGCTVDLPNVLIYNPGDPACRTAVTVSTVSAPVTATLCQAYSSGTFAIAGGAPTYNISLTNGPAGISASPASLAAPGNVTLQGTPILSANGPGQASTIYAATLVVTDASPATNDAAYPVSLTVTDPFFPYTASALATTLTATAVGSSSTTVSSIGGNGATTYTAGTPAPPLPAGEVTFGIDPTTGIATLTRSAGATTGSSTVVVTASDTACGGGTFQHQATVTLNLQY